MRVNSWDKRGDVVPIFVGDILLEIEDIVEITILRDGPDEYLEVFFTPILLNLPIFEHLVDSGREHPENGLVADVIGDDLSGSIELCAVYNHIPSEFRLPVFLKSSNEFDHFLLGLEERFRAEGSFREGGLLY